jgi:hypothetical protein
MTCPECGGPRYVDHPAGALVYRHEVNRCSLGAGQDATQAADASRLADPLVTSTTRPPSATEATLLASLAMPVPTLVTVTRLTSSSAVVRREYGA